MEKTTNKGKVFIIVGNFNVWIEVEGNQEARELTSLMNTFGLTQQVNDPTHRGGHTLDHVYVDEFQIGINC